jgi:hypothetical protein
MSPAKDRALFYFSVAMLTVALLTNTVATILAILQRNWPSAGRQSLGMLPAAIGLYGITWFRTLIRAKYATLYAEFETQEAMRDKMSAALSGLQHTVEHLRAAADDDDDAERKH